MFSDMDLRAKLLAEATEEGFKDLIRQQAKDMASDQKRHDLQRFSYVNSNKQEMELERDSTVSQI